MTDRPAKFQHLNPFVDIEAVTEGEDSAEVIEGTLSSFEFPAPTYDIVSATHIECSHGVQIPESNCPQYSVHVDSMFQKYLNFVRISRYKYVSSLLRNFLNSVFITKL